MPSLIDPVYEVYADGGVEIEEAGPCRRLTFSRLQNGETPVPVFCVVMPTGEVLGLMKKIAAAALLTPDDIGDAAGSA